MYCCQQPMFTGCMPPWQYQGWQGGLANMNNQMMGMPIMPNQSNQMQDMTSVMPFLQGSEQTLPSETSGQLPIEQSYIENILRLNRGKLVTVYMSFDGEAGASTPQVFTGIIEAAGRDHIILSDQQTGMRYLLLMVYLNYVTFEEEIEYRSPVGQMATYSPR
ncbi:spore coat protein GerQ [Pseudogracilibacillus sp. SO30301A]|uniref:spore coat protein GerQ n=1 Tax=Pseudogracilibacillus sp. SO30301A TaxID=3098291 RepID=UPI00300DD274